MEETIKTKIELADPNIIVICTLIGFVVFLYYLNKNIND